MQPITVNIVEMKQLFFLALASLSVFVAASTVSYFVLSDGHGVRLGADGIIRLGLPFMMFERGGIDYRCAFYWRSATGNLAFATASTALVMGFGYLLRQARGRKG